MDREQAQATWMDAEFTALLTRWQDTVPLSRPGISGTVGATMWQVCHTMKDWLGPDITTRDAMNPLIERLDPERICARITDVAGAAGVSRPQTMLAVLALIDRIVAAEKGPDAESIRRLWTQHLEESWLSKAWAGDFKPGQRSVRWPSDH